MSDPNCERHAHLMGDGRCTCGSEMKSIEERIAELYDTWPRMDKAAIRRTMVALAADLQAEKEKEVAELRAVNFSLTELLKLPDDYCLACGGTGGHQEACDGTSGLVVLHGVIQKQTALLDEVKRVLGDLTNRLEHSLTGDLEKAVEQELAEVKETVDQLLTRLGGSHE